MTAPPRRRIALDDDSGATLIFALIIVTVVALVVSGMLSFADTSLRTTVAVRDQGAAAATADGAAQAAINTLRLSPYNNNTSSSTYPQCFGTTDILVLRIWCPAGPARPPTRPRCSAVRTRPPAPPAAWCRSRPPTSRATPS